MRQKILIFAAGLLVATAWWLGPAIGPGSGAREAVLKSQNNDRSRPLVRLASAEAATASPELGYPRPLSAVFPLEKIIPAVVRVATKSTAGSGVLVDPAGLVLTSAHLLGDDLLATVTLEDRTTLVGTVAKVDMTRDLALIELSTRTEHWAELGTEAAISLGAPAYAMGYPLNMEGPATITAGVVSRYLHEPEMGRKVIQTDAAINLGNSGGPLLDGQGRIIGIISSILGDYPAKPTEGIGFAVSVATIREHFLE